MPPKPLPKYHRVQPLALALTSTLCQRCDMTLKWDCQTHPTRPPIYRAMCDCSEWEMEPQVATIIETRISVDV